MAGTDLRPVEPAGEFVLPPGLRSQRRRLTDRLPWLYRPAVFALRMRRRWRWLTSGSRWAVVKQAPLPVRVKPHKSLLLRTLGESEMRLQHNKVVNLGIAAPKIDGLLLRPGETFSFCRTVGRADRPMPHSYRVHARHERFVEVDGRWFRQNQIWRTVIDRRTGDRVGEELVKTNCALVRYVPAEAQQNS